MALGPASLFLLVSGDNNIHLAELKGSEITQARSTVLGMGKCLVSGASAAIAGC